jgi:putative PIN family toxin of toxin-antitoxin system
VNAVVDTNVLISGMLWFGRAHEALALVLSRYTLVQSRATLQEFDTVIRRPRLAEVLSARGIPPETLVETVATQSDFYEISGSSRTRAARIPIADAGDRPFLELVLESDAAWLVSGDKHLLELGAAERARVVRVADFLRTHGER